MNRLPPLPFPIKIRYSLCILLAAGLILLIRNMPVSPGFFQWSLFLLPAYFGVFALIRHIQFRKMKPPISIPCKICDRGELIPRRLFRLSTPAVVIGFILLIPSVFGMFISGISLVIVLATGAEKMGQARANAMLQMRGDELPQTVIDAVLDGREPEVNQWIAHAEQQGVPQAKLAGIRDAQSMLHSGSIKSSVGMLLSSGLTIAIGVASFVGGLLGWLLVMKRRVLQCSVCGATVNA